MPQERGQLSLLAVISTTPSGVSICGVNMKDNTPSRHCLGACHIAELAQTLVTSSSSRKLVLVPLDSSPFSLYSNVAVWSNNKACSSSCTIGCFGTGADGQDGIVEWLTAHGSGASMSHAHVRYSAVTLPQHQEVWRRKGRDEMTKSSYLS